MEREQRSDTVDLHRHLVRREHLRQMLGDAGALSVELVVNVRRELAHGRESSRHSERVAVVGSALRDIWIAPGIEQVHHIRAATECGDRQSAADDLPEGCDIWRHAIELLGAAGSDSEGDHLVEYQEDAELSRNFAQTLEELDGRGDHAARADDRLQDHSGQLTALPPDDCFGRVCVVERQHDGVFHRPCGRTD